MPSPDFSQYIDLTPLDVDPAAVYTGAIELARLSMPEFTLRQGTPEDAIFQAMSFMTGITAGAINRLPSRLMVGVANLLGYSRFEGTRATISATITLADYDAATIPRGTIVSWPYEDESGELFQYAFEVIENLDISAGTPPTLPTGTANLRSTIGGYIPPIPAGAELTIITTNTAILSAITTDSFINGQDPETDLDYLNSITTHMASLSGGIATGSQLQSFILSNYREVARCKVYDLTNPSTSLAASALQDDVGFATIYVYGRSRQMTSTERTTIQTEVESKLSAGIVQSVLEANICGVAVRASVSYDDRWAESDISDAVDDAVTEYLGPNTHPSFDTQIRANSVLSVISRVSGVLYVTDIALRPIGSAFNEKQWADVRCATTANITIATALNSGDIIDGITLVDGDRVLVKNQSTASQNGIYIVGSSPSRATDADATGDFAENKLIYVTSGTTNSATYWEQTTSAAITVDTTSIAFGSATSFQTLTYAQKGSLPDVSLGSIDLTLTGITV